MTHNETPYDISLEPNSDGRPRGRTYDNQLEQTTQR